MKKKHKFIFKIDSNLRGKVYLNGKWQKDVCEIEIFGEPDHYTVGLVQYARKNGRLVTDGTNILKETSAHTFVRK